MRFNNQVEKQGAHNLKLTVGLLRCEEIRGRCPGLSLVRVLECALTLALWRYCQDPEGIGAWLNGQKMQRFSEGDRNKWVTITVLARRIFVTLKRACPDATSRGAFELGAVTMLGWLNGGYTADQINQYCAACLAQWEGSLSQ